MNLTEICINLFVRQMGTPATLKRYDLIISKVLFEKASFAEQLVTLEARFTFLQYEPWCVWQSFIVCCVVGVTMPVFVL